MKYGIEYCKKYCSLYPCERKDCNRKPVLYPDKIVMEELDVYNRYRIPEKKRAYMETRVTRTNF